MARGGSLKFYVTHLQDVVDLMEFYPPVPAYLTTAGCTSLYPACRHDKMKKRYREATPTEIAPFWIKYEKTGSYPIRVNLVWFCQLTDELLVRCEARIFEGEVPKYEHMGSPPRWAHLSVGVERNHRGNIIRRYTISRLELDLPYAKRPRIIHWYADPPQPVTLYWTEPELTLADIAPAREEGA